MTNLVHLEKLSPEKIREAEQLTLGLKELLDSEITERTRKDYKRDFEDFVNWCNGFGVSPLPAEPGTVAHYIEHLRKTPQENNGKPYKLSAIRKKVTAISQAHEISGQDNPTKSSLVSRALKSLAKKRKFTAVQPEPLMIDEARLIVDNMTGEVRESRDKALILLGIGGMLRESELVALKGENLKFKHDRVIIHIEVSKTDQGGQGEDISVMRFVDETDGNSPSKYCPVQALEDWIKFANINQGGIFRQIKKGGKIQPDSISVRAIDQIIQHYATKNSLGKGYSGHSLRSGGATSAYANGATEIEIMHQGRWKTLQVVKDRYINKGKAYAKRNASSKMAFGRPMNS